MNHESSAAIESRSRPGVSFRIARMSFGRRLELMRRIRDLAECEAEFVRAMTGWVDPMAGVIRDHATQWYHFQRYWEL